MSLEAPSQHQFRANLTHLADLLFKNELYKRRDEVFTHWKGERYWVENLVPMPRE